MRDVEANMAILLRKILAAVVLLAFAANLYAAGDKYYVQSKVAKLYAEKSFSSKVVSTLKQGDEIILIQKGDNWASVKIGKLTGWIPVLLISEQRPVSRSSVLIEKSDAIEKNARRRASSTSVAGAARGLQGDDSEQEENLKTDYKALEKVEETSHTDAEIKKFMKEGLK
jgi:uncharacterized protein YgiM (DUF1202 family)